MTTPPEHAPRWTEYRPIEDLPDAPVNPKTHNIPGIATSIETFAFIAGGLVLDERTGSLLGGHGTRDALQHLRDRGAPAPDGIVIDGDTWMAPLQRGWSSNDDTHAAAAGIALNNHTVQGGFQQAELLGVLDELTIDNPALILGTGYDDRTLEDLRAHVDQLNAAAGLDPAPTPDHYDDDTTGTELDTATDTDTAAAPDATMQPLARTYGVIIHARDGEHQAQLLDELAQLGYKPAALP